MASEVLSSEQEALVAHGPGQRLAAARESKHLSREDVASELRLDVRIIEALERDDYDALPSAVFVRGYLRRCATLLDINVSELLAASEPVDRDEIQPAPHAKRPARRVHLPRIPWGALGIMFLIAVLAGVLFTWGPGAVNWFRDRIKSDDESTRRLVLPGQADTPALLPPVPGEAVPDTQPTDTVPGNEQDSKLIEPQLDEIALAAVEPSIEEVAPEVSPATIRIELDFAEDSWVELNAADGTRLLYGLLKKGQRREVEGQAPVSVLLGNRSGVTIRVDGVAVDKARDGKSNVSRFELDGTH